MGDIDDVSDTVADELAFDPDVDASDITVRAVGGAVLLTGTVPSYPQYLAAVADARRIAGARKVRDDLEIRLPPGDVRDDAALTVAANDALTLNEAAPGRVRARAENGDVILTGTVRDATERAAAELLVAALTGVRRVTNDIEVRAAADLGRATGRPEQGGA
jgi:osmotically-inducible protein OsmY